MFDNLSVFCICTYMFPIKLPENDLKKIETYWSISIGSYVIVFILILVRLVALCIEKFAEDDSRDCRFSPLSC